MSVETALSYASLILADADMDISRDNLSKLLSKANIEIETIWMDLFAKGLENKNLKDFLFNISSAAPMSTSTVTTEVSEEVSKSEEKKVEEKEESDDDMGFGLFD